ncbi:hypothetical protein [Paucisalibacillus sp. EB02]|uniref:hypothetical protein n=1 Tax=Paucisalibacillus sp. EB02 TaxID=1347087 RepID=UPI0005A7DDC1|nr:hypothetical protein [Paucisalibacillus sp. EB02]
MKRFYKFVLCFLILFIINLTVNALLKPDLDVRTAFSVALGVLLGYSVVDWYLNKKSKKE